MTTPIIDGLKKYIAEENLRMHMPGHKAKKKLKEIGNLIPDLDVTEVRGVDNLHNAEEMILQSQKNASRVFLALHTLYSVNGTTAGIYAAINSQTCPGDKILISRDSHKSVYQAIILGNLDCDYLYPEYDRENDILIGIDPREIEEKLKNEANIKVVVVNYPSYYGVCSDIEEIARVVHKYGRILIVDEAHGSHLVFNNNLPISALEAGADIVVQSTHKTLPAFTQSSMVHVGTENVSIEKLRLHMSIYQTTSPSYILMSSIDYAVDYMDNFGYKELQRVTRKIEEITAELNKLARVKIYNGKKNGDRAYGFDQTKFLFKINGIPGTRLEVILRDDYNIQVELSDHYYCLALITVFDDNDDLEKLKKAIEDISRDHRYAEESLEENFPEIRNIIPEIVISPYKAFYSEKNSIQLEQSINLISGQAIVPYPPGIPILVPGEKITREIVDYIEALVRENIEILGIRKDTKEIKIISHMKEGTR